MTLNSVTQGYRFLEKRPMYQEKTIGKIVLKRRELGSKACPFFGGHQYQLVLRGNMQPQAGRLFARCSSASVLVDSMKISV